MPNSKLRFYFREPTVDTNMPITDGTVKVEGFELEIVKREDDADAWDCGFAARVRAHARGLAHVSIPAFPNRKFRLSYIYVNSKAGSNPRVTSKASALVSPSGTIPRACGRGARCRIITESISPASTGSPCALK